MAAYFTINADGSVTFLPSGGSLDSGPLAAISKTPQPGDVFLALDQPKGQQVYICNSPGAWYQFISLGSSGALTYEGGSLDINPAIIPLLDAANDWKGLNRFTDIEFTGTIKGIPLPAMPMLPIAGMWFQAWQSAAQTIPGSTETPISLDVIHPNSSAEVTPIAKTFSVPREGSYSGIGQLVTNSYFGGIDLSIFQTTPAGVRTRVARTTVSDATRAYDGLAAQIKFSTYAEVGDSLSFSLGAGTGLVTVIGKGATQFTFWKT